MQTIQTDRDGYDAISTELSERQERREGALVIITGFHEVHGRVILQRHDGVFTVSAKDVSFARHRNRMELIPIRPSDAGLD